MKPKGLNSLDRALRMAPPWKGTPAERLLRELVPPGEPHPEEWYALIWGELAAIVRDSRRAAEPTGEELLKLRRLERLYGVLRREPEPRSVHARIAAVKREAQRYRALAQRAEFALPPRPEEAERHRQRAALLEANYRVEKKNLRSKPKGNRAEKPERWRIVRLLGDVRWMTGKPHHETVAALLGLVGYRTTVAKLKMLEHRAKPKK